MTSPVLNLASLIASKPVDRSQVLEVFNPYDQSLVGTVVQAQPSDLNRAIERALEKKIVLNRYERSEILERARSLLESRRVQFAEWIRLESGLCQRETEYEVGRALDVLKFSAMEALKDDGEIFSCDISPQGKNRKIFTTREPLSLIAAITPFNHPLNQVVHKLGPAIAADVPTILKPSDKTPLTALKFTELLYESGLPEERLSTLVGSIEGVIEPLIQDPRVALVSFTGSAQVGKHISKIAGYKKLCLELGGNSPLIILRDANLELATKLAAEGCFRNSGQRCTAVKRVLIEHSIKEEFIERFLSLVKEYPAGDPASPTTRVGTVIDENAAIQLENRVQAAVEMGAKVLYGGKRQGAQLEPTVIDDVPREAEMVVEESFGPLAPLMEVQGLEDAVALANSTAFGLSAGVVTENLTSALYAIKNIRTGTVNINEVPGYRIESSPFGGIKDSGLGIKEGVIEAMQYMTTKKTFSLPW